MWRYEGIFIDVFRILLIVFRKNRFTNQEKDRTKCQNRNFEEEILRKTRSSCLKTKIPLFEIFLIKMI